MSELDGNELESSFNSAAKHFPSLVSQLSKEKLLYFYGRYKQATEGNCNVSKPSLFDQTGRRKWEAWADLKGTTKYTAMKEYIDGVKEIDPEWNEDDTKNKEVGWARVSRMPVPERDETVSFIDAVQEGNLEVLNSLNLEEEVKQRFEEGMTGLHWAADRGHTEVVDLLLTNGAEVNARDDSGQTPLHYAASCGHVAVVSLLLQRGADPSMCDDDDFTPRQVADDSHVVTLLS
ncbi:Ankyrin repeat-containing domain [Trinorchestia longiramus]|nr:Ankyrin repeat-containing domain [Trinorchestia longiramus]